MDLFNSGYASEPSLFFPRTPPHRERVYNLMLSKRSIIQSAAIGIFLTLILFFAGCDGTDIFDYNHPKVAAATKQARTDVDKFIQALDTRTQDQKSFAILVKIENELAVEHVWAANIKLEDNRFVAQISEAPKEIHSVHQGDSIKVKQNEILDWMYVDDGKLVGGYTIRAMRDMLTQKERDGFDQSIPFHF